MYCILETDKSFKQASTDLESAVKQHDFGVLHAHDLGTTLRSVSARQSTHCKTREDTLET